jgi:hypothetical protein
MHPNGDLITRFYSAFHKKDFVTMQKAYHSEARFSDPVFPNLSAGEVKAMWQMLVTSAQDLQVTCSNVSADDQKGTCQWHALYTFTASGRRVHNIIHASFTFSDGKIIKHQDHFDFWRWSRMALGPMGWLLGWSPLVKNKVRKTAGARLAKFIQKRINQ